jgi:hypothetical protein
MKKKLYRQCVLKRKTEDGVVIQTSYLPERYAKVGEVLKLKDGGVWTDGWVVESVGELKDEPPNYRQIIKGHRRGTGDDLIKRNNKNEN